MIRALITGKLHDTPQARTSATGNTFAIAKMKADDKAGAWVWVSVIAFGAESERLLELKAGDAVAIGGRAELSVWQDRDGNHHPGLSLVAAEVVQKLDARIAATTAKRAALIDRRAAGQGDDDEDAGTLALLDADLDRLSQLRILAAHDYDNAVRATEERRLHLRDAQRELDCATAAHQAELLEPQLRELERTLLSGIGRLSTLKRIAAGIGGNQRLHARQVYAVSPALGRFVQHNVIPSDVAQ